MLVGLNMSACWFQKVFGGFSERVWILPFFLPAWHHLETENHLKWSRRLHGIRDTVSNVLSRKFMAGTCSWSCWVSNECLFQVHVSFQSGGVTLWTHHACKNHPASSQAYRRGSEMNPEGRHQKYKVVVTPLQYSQHQEGTPKSHVVENILSLYIYIYIMYIYILCIYIYLMYIYIHIYILCIYIYIHILRSPFFQYKHHDFDVCFPALLSV